MAAVTRSDCGTPLRWRLILTAQSTRLLIQDLADGRRWHEAARADLITWGPCRGQWQARSTWLPPIGWRSPTTLATRAEAEELLTRQPRDAGDVLEVRDQRSPVVMARDEGRQLELPGTGRATASEPDAP